MRRRRFFELVSTLGYVVAATGAPAAVRAAAQARNHVRLGYLGNACEAATIVAPADVNFAHHGLAARLVRFDSETALIGALDAGGVDAASMKLPALLAPLERRRNIRIAAGLHAGCMRVLARDALSIDSFADLKGTTVAVDRLGGSSMRLFSALLRRQGIDPRRDLNWGVFAPDALEAALDAKTVRCVTASDPLGYFLLTDRKVEPYLDSTGGGFSCGTDLASGHHCFLVLSGALVASHPATAAALTRAYLGATAAVGRGVGPAAVAEQSAGFAQDIHDTLGMLSSYDWNASTDYVVEELELTARDFRRAGLLDASTDPIALADRSFADVLHG